MKKILAIMLAVMFVMMLLPMSAFAAAGGSEVQEEAVGGEVTTDATYNRYVYIYPAFWNGSQYTRNGYWTGSNPYYGSNANTVSTSNYGIKANKTYTATGENGTATVAGTFYTSTSMTNSNYWKVTIAAPSSTTKVYAHSAFASSESSMYTLGSGWQLKGFTTQVTNSFTSTWYESSVTTVTSFSDLRTKLASANYTTSNTYLCVALFFKAAAAATSPTAAQPTPSPSPVAATIRNFNNSSSSIIGDRTQNIYMNQATTITASATGTGFDTENYNYSFLRWEAGYGTMTFGSAYSATTTVTVTAKDSTFGVRIICRWTVTEKTRPNHTLTIVTTVDGTQVASTSTELREVTGSMTIAPDKTLFNTNAYTYTFQGWTITSGSVANAQNESTTFTMGTADATATAAFTTTTNNNPGTGAQVPGTNPADGEYKVKFYVLYVDDSFNLGYNYENGWDVYYNCQDTYCSHVNATTHTMALSVIKNQIEHATVEAGWAIQGWTKTASATPSANSAEGTGTALITVGDNIYLVAQKDATATAQKTFTVQYKLNNTTAYSTSVTLTNGVWDTVTINGADYMAQAGVPTSQYALTGATSYTHAWATFPSSVDFDIEPSTAPFTVSGCTITSTYTSATQLSELAYAIGHKTAYDSTEFKSFRKALSVTVNGLTAATEVTVYTAPRGGEARLDYVTLVPTASEVDVEYDEVSRYVVVTGYEQIKGIWIAQGHYTTYSAMKADKATNNLKNVTNKWKYSPIVSTEALEYTCYIKMNDATSCYKYITVQATAIPEIEIEISDCTVFVTDETMQYVTKMYVAKGHYTAYADMKAGRSTNGFKNISQALCYTFPNINAETEITVCYKDVNDEVDFEYFTITPDYIITVTNDGSTVTVSTGNLSNIKYIYFAAGHCTTLTQMKAAQGYKRLPSGTYSWTPDFSLDANGEFTVRVVTADGNILYWSVFANGDVTAR